MPDLAENFNDYTLSRAEALVIFEQHIIPEELNHLETASVANEGRKPLAVFVVGQTGAGKTRAAPAIMELMQTRRGRLSHFIADTYKTYHPAYSRLMEEKPALASSATGTDARRWLSMAAAYAIERRVDVLVESACRHPQDFTELAQAFHDGGYRVEVVILAVPKALSRLGILTRFYERLPEAGSRNLPIRLTPRKVHDDSYRGLMDVAIFVDESQAADQVVVLRRNNMVAYTNERINGSWREHARTANSLLFERRYRLLEAERSLADHDLVQLYGKDIPGLLPQLKEIEGLLEFPQAENKPPPLKKLALPNIDPAAWQTEVDLRLGLVFPCV